MKISFTQQIDVLKIIYKINYYYYFAELKKCNDFNVKLFMETSIISILLLVYLKVIRQERVLR